MDTGKPRAIAHVLKETQAELNQVKELLQMEELKNNDHVEEINYLKKQLSQYQGEDVAAVSIWSKETVQMLLQHKGLPLTVENISKVFDTLCDNGNTHNLHEYLFDAGRKYVYDTIDQLYVNDELFKHYSKADLYDVMENVNEEVIMHMNYDVLHETCESYPEMRVTIHNAIDMTWLGREIADRLVHEGIEEDQVEYEVLEPMGSHQEKEVRFLFNNGAFHSVAEVTRIMKAIKFMINPFVGVTQF